LPDFKIQKAVDTQFLPVSCDQRAINKDRFLKTGDPNTSLVSPQNLDFRN
jgi:hypothetical protein